MAVLSGADEQGLDRPTPYPFRDLTQRYRRRHHRNIAGLPRSVKSAQRLSDVQRTNLEKMIDVLLSSRRRCGFGSDGSGATCFFFWPLCANDSGPEGITGP